MSEPCDLSAIEARRMISAKQLSPVELVESCIKRIEATNGAVNALSLIHISEPTRHDSGSRMPSSA